MKITLLSLFIFLSFFYTGGFVQAENDFAPKISIGEAIEKAKTYAHKNEIDLSGKFIKTVDYHNNMQNRSEQPYWLVLWINKRVTKGGGVELRLYPDGSIEEKYHK